VAIYETRDFNWTKSPCPKDVPCQISMHSCQWFMRRRIFINIFLILPQKGPAPLCEQIWIYIPQACFPPSLVEIGPYVPLGCDHLWPQGVYLNKVKSPYPKDVPCQISMLSCQWFMRRFSLFCTLIGAQKGLAPLFEQIWISITQACFPPSLVEIGKVVHEKKIFKGFCYISLYKTLSP